MHKHITSITLQHCTISGAIYCALLKDIRHIKIMEIMETEIDGNIIEIMLESIKKLEELHIWDNISFEMSNEIDGESLKKKLSMHGVKLKQLTIHFDESDQEFFKHSQIVEIFEKLQNTLRNICFRFENFNNEELVWFNRYDFDLEVFKLSLSAEMLETKFLKYFINEITGQLGSRLCQPRDLNFQHLRLKKPMLNLKILDIEDDFLDEDSPINFGYMDFSRLKQLEVSNTLYFHFTFEFFGFFFSGTKFLLYRQCKN